MKNLLGGMAVAIFVAAFTGCGGRTNNSYLPPNTPTKTTQDQESPTRVVSTRIPHNAGTNAGKTVTVAPAPNAMTAEPAISGTSADSTAIGGQVIILERPTRPSMAPWKNTPSGTLSAPEGLDFGQVGLGGQSTLAFTISNSGSGTISVSSVYLAGANQNEYSLTGPTSPFFLKSGKSASFSVTFSPGAIGTAYANVTIFSSATNSNASVALTGTGFPHRATLAWYLSPSENGATCCYYVVYRSLQSGGPYSPIAVTAMGMTSYTDTPLSGGTTYYYVIAASTTDGTMSAYSNETGAAVPAP